jgi:hypothetical protein
MHVWNAGIHTSNIYIDLIYKAYPLTFIHMRRVHGYIEIHTYIHTYIHGLHMCIHRIDTYICAYIDIRVIELFGFELAEKETEQSWFPVHRRLDSYEILPNALFETGNRLGCLSCLANSNANGFRQTQFSNSRKTEHVFWIHTWQHMSIHTHIHLDTTCTHAQMKNVRMHTHTKHIRIHRHTSYRRQALYLEKLTEFSLFITIDGANSHALILLLT